MLFATTFLSKLLIVLLLATCFKKSFLNSFCFKAAAVAVLVEAFVGLINTDDEAFFKPPLKFSFFCFLARRLAEFDLERLVSQLVVVH